VLLGTHWELEKNMLGTKEKHCKKLVETHQLLASGQAPLKSMSTSIISLGGCPFHPSVPSFHPSKAKRGGCGPFLNCKTPLF